MTEAGNDMRICPIKVFVEEELRHMCPWNFPYLQSLSADQPDLFIHRADPYLNRAPNPTQAKQSLMTLAEIHKSVTGLRRPLLDIDALLLHPPYPH